MRNNKNVWHKPNYEYGFEDGEEQYRIFTDENNTISFIWINGADIPGNKLDLEIIGAEIFKTTLYGVWHRDPDYDWNENEFARVRNLQKKRS